MTNLQVIVLAVIVIIGFFIYANYNKKPPTFQSWSASCTSNGDKVVLLTNYQITIYVTNGKSYFPTFTTHYILGCKGDYSNAPISEVYDTTNKNYTENI